MGIAICTGKRGRRPELVEDTRDWEVVSSNPSVGYLTEIDQVYLLLF